VRSLRPTGQLTESSIPPHLNCSSPYLPGPRAQPTVTHDHVQKNEEAPLISTRYRIRYQDATDRDLDTPKRNSPESLPGAPRCFATFRYGIESSTTLSRYADAEIKPSFSHGPKTRTRRVRRAVGAAQGPSTFYQDDAEPCYDCGPEVRTRLFRALGAQGPSGYYGDDTVPSYGYGPEVRTRLFRALGAQGPSGYYGDDTVPSYGYGPEVRTRLFRALGAQGLSDFYDDETVPSYGDGPTIKRRLVRRSVKVQDQRGLPEDQSGLSSSVGYIASTLLSRDPLNAQEQLSLSDDENKLSSSVGPASSPLKAHEQLSLSDDEPGPTSSAGSDTLTSLSHSPSKAAEQSGLSNNEPEPSFSIGLDASLLKTNDDSPPHLQSASSFLVSTLTPAAFQSATYPTDRIIYVKLGSRVLSRIVPLNMSSEARARCEAGTPFIEGLLTSTLELKPRCLKGLALIEGVLMDEVAKILAAESLADLRRYDHGTESLAELGIDQDEKLRAMDGLLEDKDAGEIVANGNGSVKGSMPVNGMPAQAMDGLLEDKDVMKIGMEGEGSVKMSKVVQGMTYLVLQDQVPTGAAAAKQTLTKDDQPGDQEWEVVDVEMEVVEMAEDEPLNMKGYGEAWMQGWTLL